MSNVAAITTRLTPKLMTRVTGLHFGQAVRILSPTILLHPNSSTAPTSFSVYVYDVTTKKIFEVSSSITSNVYSPKINSRGDEVVYTIYLNSKSYVYERKLLMTSDKSGKLIIDRVLHGVESLSGALIPTGSEASWNASISDLSPDNNPPKVAFSLNLSNLTPSDTNNVLDVFVWNSVNSWSRVSEFVYQGTIFQPSAVSRHSAISAKGRHVAFVSQGTSLQYPCTQRR